MTWEARSESRVARTTGRGDAPRSALEGEGEDFTAADISVTYALHLGQRHCDIALDDALESYLARTTGRDAYKRSMDRFARAGKRLTCNRVWSKSGSKPATLTRALSVIG